MPLISSGDLGVCQPDDPAVAEIFDVDVVLADIGDPRSDRSELRVHERRGRRISAELAQLVAGPVEDPVIASGVLPPDPLGVGEDQEPRPILGQRIAVDEQRVPSRGAGSGGGGDQDLALAGRGVVRDQVLPPDGSFEPSSIV